MSTFFNMVLLCTIIKFSLSKRGHSSYSLLYDHIQLLLNNYKVINSTTNDMISKFEAFSKKKIDALYLTEIIRTEWLKMLYKYWDERDKSFSGYFDFWPQWLFQYYNELPIVESIEIVYLTWNPEQQILISKDEILRPLVPLVKHYNVTVDEDDEKFKITCKCCSEFVTCSVKSRVILYITFINAIMSTHGLYPEDLVPEILLSMAHQN